ncbi:transporter substrate-binding domain-containing protein [Tamlana haliotis]|uniref:Transporter substrate-binding domain-containing protein n=1 Tax=Pseudotamlana haliotis TaxID=2614804 RepID=A0A6N6MIK1_9FLAO|nr:transporter substrate-binding domain-containing protein [Tamlana haliotis]KAB1070903.1 transporter substrate-binding domain-containing protein [Tamlana haliotis]
MKKLLTFFVLLLFVCIHDTFSQQKDHLVEKDTLLIGYSIDPPFCYKENGKLQGISVRMWEKLNKTHPEKVYVYKEYILDDLINDLEYNEIDLALSPLTITSDRNAIIDFSMPYFVSECRGLIKSKNHSGKLMSFVTSFFSFNFLKVIGFLLLLLTIFGFLVWLFEHKHNEEEFGGGVHGFLHGVWWSAVTMTTVGYGDKSPKTIGGRVVGLVWMFSAIILISGITASITSSLTVDKLKVSDTDYTGFKAYEVGTVKHSATEGWLTDHFFHDVSVYPAFEDALEALDHDKIQAIAYDEPLMRFYLKDITDHDYELSQFSFNKSMYAMGFSKQLDADYKKKISDEIIAFIESSDWQNYLAHYNLLEGNK